LEYALLESIRQHNQTFEALQTLLEWIKKIDDHRTAQGPDLRKETLEALDYVMERVARLEHAVYGATTP
jgi:hypothetical protein